MHQPTGTGKTFTAVLVIDHFLSLRPGKKVMFVVPPTPAPSAAAGPLRAGAGVGVGSDPRL